MHVYTVANNVAPNLLRITIGVAAAILLILTVFLLTDRKSVKVFLAAALPTVAVFGLVAAAIAVVTSFIATDPAISTRGKYFIDAAQPVMTWVTVGFVITAVLIALWIIVKNKPFLSTYLKAATFSSVAFALTEGIVLLVADCAKHYDKAYLENNYVSLDVTKYVLIPIAVTLFIMLVGAVASFVLSYKKSSKAPLVIKITGVATVLSLAVTLVLITTHFNDNISGDGYYTAEGAKFNNTMLYVFAAVLVLIAVAAAFLIDKDRSPFTAKVIARGGVAIALSFALSYVKLFQLPQGGAVTLASTLPLMIFAYSYGPKKGLLVGLIYGLLQAVQDPFIIHPAQFLLDYPVAFMMFGFAGVFIRTKLPVQLKFAFGAVLTSLLRFISHVISGVFAFGAYAADAGATSFLWYSVAYNSFVFVDIAIALVVGVLLLSNKSFRKLVIQ